MCVSHVIFPAFAVLLPFCVCVPCMPNTNHTTLRMSFSAGWLSKTRHSSSLIVFGACGCNILHIRIRNASFHIEKHSGPGKPSRSNSGTSSNDVNLDPVTCPVEGPKLKSSSRVPSTGDPSNQSRSHKAMKNQEKQACFWRHHTAN